MLRVRVAGGNLEQRPDAGTVDMDVQVSVRQKITFLRGLRVRFFSCR